MVEEVKEEEVEEAAVVVVNRKRKVMKKIIISFWGLVEMPQINKSRRISRKWPSSITLIKIKTIQKVPR